MSLCTYLLSTLQTSIHLKKRKKKFAKLYLSVEDVAKSKTIQNQIINKKSFLLTSKVL